MADRRTDTVITKKLVVLREGRKRAAEPRGEQTLLETRRRQTSPSRGCPKPSTCEERSVREARRGSPVPAPPAAPLGGLCCRGLVRPHWTPPRFPTYSRPTGAVQRPSAGLTCRPAWLGSPRERGPRGPGALHLHFGYWTSEILDVGGVVCVQRSVNTAGLPARGLGLACRNPGFGGLPAPHRKERLAAPQLSADHVARARRLSFGCLGV